MKAKIKEDAATFTEASEHKIFFSALVHATPELCSKMNVVLNQRQKGNQKISP